MPTADYDIAILGAGPVGQALALLLARLVRDPARIALLAGDSGAGQPGAGQPGAAQPAPTDDPRIIAINHGSRVLLESLQAWPARSAAIDHIHVSQRGRLGRTVITRDDFDVPALGNTVSYADLHARLQERVVASGITRLSGPPAAVDAQDAQAVHVRQGNAALRCAVAVRCDGAGGQDVKSVAQASTLTRLPSTRTAYTGNATPGSSRHSPVTRSKCCL